MRGQKSFLRNPKTHTILVIVFTLALYLYLTNKSGQIPAPIDLLKSIFYLVLMRFHRIPQSVRLLALDGLLCFGGIFLWMAFFSQFILPVRRLQERFNAMDRLTIYLAQEHGPAIFVENGRVQERQAEARKRGPGVIILDAASSAIVRNDFSFLPPSGPGVVFTRNHEYLAKAVDLHTRSVTLGPTGNEDPFQPRAEFLEMFQEFDDVEALYERMQARRMTTSALTRDGVEVVPKISVTYRLKYGRPWDPANAYRYYPPAVQQWVTADGPQATTTNPRWANIPLADLPGHMAAEVWREYLQKFTLAELFTAPIPNPAGGTAFARISGLVSQRLTRPMVQGLDNFGQPSGELRVSEEYLELRMRGIRVLGVGIHELRLAKSIEDRLVEVWKATWLDRARSDAVRVEHERNNQVLVGKNDALVRFVLAAIRGFPPNIQTRPRPVNDAQMLVQMRYTLSRLARTTRVELRSDPRISPLSQVEDTQLSDLLEWTGEQQ